MFSGPGKSFRKGLTLVEIVQQFDSEQKAEDWFIAQRWPNGITCAHCSGNNISDRPGRKPQRFHCRNCRKYFSVKTKTVLQSSNIPLSKWAIGFFLYSTHLKGISSMKLHRDLGITQKSAWHMGHRIREAWDTFAGKFSGPVEVDETYIGGKERNRHVSKKLNVGRGVAGKTPVAGLLDRQTNQITTQVIPSTTKNVIVPFIEGFTLPDTLVFTDEFTAYQTLNRPRTSVNHSAKQFVDGIVSTNGIESHWALMKRGYMGVYHHWSVKHLPRYVHEFAARHNLRPLDTAVQMTRIVQGAIGKRLRYSDLVNSVGPIIKPPRRARALPPPKP